jgi:hypothetical protein
MLGRARACIRWQPGLEYIGVGLRTQILLEDHMSSFAENSTDFAAECARRNGRCKVARDNFLLLESGTDVTAVDQLQNRCGHVVIIPHGSSAGQAWLYHTSCQRMTDVVRQIFPDCLDAPVSLPQASSEMSLGEMQRRRVGLSYDDCKARVDGFRFYDAS